MKPQNHRELITGYLKRFPKSSKKTIAEKIFKDHPLKFTDAEAVRRSVRYYTGANGSGDRKDNKQIIAHDTNFTRENPYGLPPSEADKSEIYKLPKANNRILFLTDIHLPYHDIEALTLALKYGKEMNVNTIWLNGDILDCYKASSHEQDPAKRDMAYELEQGRLFIDLLKREFPKAKIFWKEGNHEMRWKRFLRVKAPLVLGIPEFEMPILLKLGEKGVTWIPNKQLAQAGKLNIIHGNEYKGGGGINVARTLWLRAGSSVIAGDKHKTQSGLKTNIDKSVVGTWSVGCLSELNPDYLPFNEWNLGFAFVEVFSDDNFTVHNKQVINGKVH